MTDAEALAAARAEVERLEVGRDKAGAVVADLLGLLLKDSPAISQDVKDLAERILKMLGTQVKGPDSAEVVS
jgi:hypothetical protein